jgi:COMPASS component SPP1
LPQRIQEWGLTPCIAEEKNKKELEQIRKQQTDAREALEELDLKQKVEFYHCVNFS